MSVVGIIRAVHSSTEMSSFIASAAPLRGRRIINNTTITENADAVLTDESVTIVCSFPDPSRAFIARIVPVADVIPGMIDTSIPARLPVIIDKIEDFFSSAVSVSFSIFCSGITGFVINELRSVGIPNNPARAGNKTGASSPIGESREKSRITRPKMPERKNTNVANSIPETAGRIPLAPKSSILAFSVASMRIDIAMSIQTMISCRVE